MSLAKSISRVLTLEAPFRCPVVMSSSGCHTRLPQAVSTMIRHCGCVGQRQDPRTLTLSRMGVYRYSKASDTMMRLESRLSLGPLSATREGPSRPCRRVLTTISFSRLRRWRWRGRRVRWLWWFAKFSEFLGRIRGYGRASTNGAFCRCCMMAMISLSRQSMSMV